MAQDRQTAGMDVYQSIYELLLNGSLKPGDRLTEAKLAKRFGISRTPVREALRRLQTQGLLQHQPYRGMVVATLDPQAVTELYVMREVLEGTAAALAAKARQAFRHAGNIGEAGRGDPAVILFRRDRNPAAAGPTADQDGRAASVRGRRA